MFKIRLEKIINIQNISINKILQELSISRSTFYRFKNGNISNMKTSLLVRLASILNTTPEYLLGWTDKNDPKIDKISIRLNNKIKRLNNSELVITKKFVDFLINSRDN